MLLKKMLACALLISMVGCKSRSFDANESDTKSGSNANVFLHQFLCRDQIKNQTGKMTNVIFGGEISEMRSGSSVVANGFLSVRSRDVTSREPVVDSSRVPVRCNVITEGTRQRYECLPQDAASAGFKVANLIPSQKQYYIRLNDSGFATDVQMLNCPYTITPFVAAPVPAPIETSGLLVAFIKFSETDVYMSLEAFQRLPNGTYMTRKDVSISSEGICPSYRWGKMVYRNNELWCTLKNGAPFRVAKAAVRNLKPQNPTANRDYDLVVFEQGHSLVRGEDDTHYAIK